MAATGESTADGCQRRHRRWVLAICVGGALAVATSEAVRAEQLPLNPSRETGQSVTPAYEGWYLNPDGTVTLSFGYFNRNTKEVMDVPVGPNNFIERGDPNPGPPTHFLPGRHWGVFTVTVPADFGDQRVVWTLTSNGETFAIPGHLHNDWLIDALHDGASGNVPPALRLNPADSEGHGPAGPTVGPRIVAVGSPLTLTVWGRDDLIRRPTDIPYGPPDRPAITMTWVKHQGPGDVTFSEPIIAINEASGEATTTATFHDVGDYIVRVTAHDYSGVEHAGHAQCCWTNGFVRVRVTR